MTILITGGCGFIGSNLINYLLKDQFSKIINIDNLTYAANNLKIDDNRYTHLNVDIADQLELTKIFYEYKPDYVIHLAAETHVDNSIDSSNIFIKTNVVGTHSLLEASLNFYKEKNNPIFKFLHVSTDEVYGSLESGFADENYKYNPSSPYAASKASSDHLVKAWYKTYKLPIMITNCTNNFGPYQHKEKLIPTIINCVLDNKPIPIYGTGMNKRDWLYVEDHCKALTQVLRYGKCGESYNIAGNNEKTNIELVNTICEIIDALLPIKKSSKHLIKFVSDRPGHDFRYAINCDKIKSIGWEPSSNFAVNLMHTITYYINERNNISGRIGN